ncbi:MAG: hypothetical protein GWN13_15830 [Phycisphaerae bacterium]|nr:hypothetical protein [Phycisphaerae bacterium]
MHVPGTDGNELWPTIAGTKNYWGTSSNVGLAYEIEAGKILYNYYQPASGGWQSSENLSDIVGASTGTHHTPSLAWVPGSTASLHVVWHLQYGSGGSLYDHSIIHREGTVSSWPNEYFELFGDWMRPSISSVSSGTANLLFQAFSDNKVYKMHYDGSGWGSETFISSSASYPSVSARNTDAKYVYTYGNTSPFTVKVSSETLTKSAGPSYCTRAINWLDGSGAYLKVHVERMYFKTQSGQEIDLGFMR